MYLREVHAEHDLDVLRTFIRENPLGIFTTAIEAGNHPFLQSSHVPFILDISDDASDTELGVLRGHMARANPQSKAMMDSLDEIGHIWSRPVHHYVTPQFYKETKPSTAKVVPTWNYAAVQVYGKATVYYQSDPATSSYLASQVDDLTNLGETKLMGYEKPWKVSDAPARYVELLSKGIIGEMPLGDREGVIAGFGAMASETSTKLSEMVKHRGELADAKKAKLQS
ncbi:negative transcriptional regulator [Gymnopus androsaceus JB14]|uniref:Negative transcriptional regulator n=1 Tax=Gymnopus androsaceus JB14 TaxID=1447944 RepID=A0A6A4IKJ5_9AGAR|nr:negative transcriptional regulator [Gymnopus androsaceus JB14]